MKVKHRIVGIAVAAWLVIVAASFPSGSIAQTTDDGPSGGIAQTTDDGPPEMDLRWPGHSLQRGSRGSFCWPDADGNGICVDTVSGFPKAMWVRSGAKMKIRIHYAEKPEDFSLVSWRAVDNHGRGNGHPQRIDVRLEPVKKAGATRAWDALFTLGGARHYYMHASATWPRGDASWSFHGRTVKV